MLHDNTLWLSWSKQLHKCNAKIHSWKPLGTVLDLRINQISEENYKNQYVPQNKKLINYRKYL